MEEKNKNTMPIFNHIWMNPTKYSLLLCGENNLSFFRYILCDYYDNLYGNIIQFGHLSICKVYGLVFTHGHNLNTICILLCIVK